MKFTYCYKSSDGVRHEEKIDASSRDEAFALLRKQGIRPIKVVADDGSKANGETRFVTRKRVVVLAVLLGAVAGVLSMRTASHVDLRDKRIIELEQAAQSVFADHEARMLAADSRVLSSATAIAEAQSSEVKRAVANSYLELNKTRSDLRVIFSGIYSTLPEGKVRDDANALFNAAMDKVDLAESQIARAEKMSEFLNSHRGEWSIVQGRVVFINPRLGDEFSEYNREL